MKCLTRARVRRSFILGTASCSLSLRHIYFANVAAKIFSKVLNISCKFSKVARSTANGQEHLSVIRGMTANNHSCYFVGRGAERGCRSSERTALQPSSARTDYASTDK